MLFSLGLFDLSPQARLELLVFTELSTLLRAITSAWFPMMAKGEMSSMLALMGDLMGLSEPRSAAGDTGLVTKSSTSPSEINEY